VHPPQNKASFATPYMLDDVQSCFIFVVITALVQAVVLEAAKKRIVRTVVAKPWWTQAMPLQSALMQSFGYKEEELTPEVCVDSYGFVISVCASHTLSGLGILPVVIWGWEEAGYACQVLFKMSVLLDVGFDLYDEVKAVCLCFFHRYFAYWGPELPLRYFVIVNVLHHPLAMIMATPMAVYHPSMAAFHKIAGSLLLAAGVCYLAGAYKFTLDMKTRSGLMQFKAIVALQAVVIVYTRGYLWFANAFELLSTFNDMGDTTFFNVGSFAVLLMSVFNLILLGDALKAAKKWLPKSMPQENKKRTRGMLTCNIPTSPRCGRSRPLLDMAGAKKFH
jgi:hypothetical protein